MLYCLVARGFEEIETVTTVDILRRAGIDVCTVGISKINSDMIVGAHNMTLVTDLKQKEVSTKNLEGIILPGGMPGTTNLEKSKTVGELVRYCAENDKYIFAICAAPQILGHMGLLKGKHATCYPGFEGELIGADYKEDASAVLDGKIVTGRGPGCTVDFAMLIVELLKGADVAEKLRDSMQCP
ncbi:MAG: DJ-1/PfpI family protein [Clostridia bacterium]|nr:DJ-1/PfpI family protein [Clostridia bacterium]